MPAVVVYGTVALDRFQRVPGHDWVERPGGEALNTALALLGWGVSVALVGTATGVDAEGLRLRQLMEEEGLPLSGVPQDERAVTPCCDIRVFPDGERQMMGRGFAQAVAPPLPRALYSGKPVVAVDPNLGESAREVARGAAAAGCPVVAMDFAHEPEIVALSQVLQVSVESLQRWGGPTGTPEAVVTQLRKQGAALAVLTQGPRGGIAASGRGIRHFSAVSIPDVVDTTGAGDAFRAGLCYGLLQAWEEDRALQFARVAAACHCQRLGGAARVSLSEIEALEKFEKKEQIFVRLG